MEEEEQLLSTLEDSADTAVRVVVLRVGTYFVLLVASVLVTRALGPEGRGMYAFPVALAGVALSLSHLGLEHANVFLTGQGVAPRALWANSTLVAATAGGMAIALVLGLYRLLGSAAFGGLPLLWIFVMIVQLPLLLMTLYWSSLLQLAGLLRKAITAVLMGACIQLALVVALYVTFQFTAFRMLLVLACANTVTWLLLLWRGRRARIAGIRPDRESLKRGMAFGLRAYVGILFVFLLFRIDQLLVQRFLGFEALGLYSLAATLAETLWIITDPFAASLLPHQVRAAAGDERRLGFATARLSLLIAGSCAIVAWFAAPIVIPMAYGTPYEGSIWPFRLLLPGIVALALQRPLAGVLLKEGRAMLISAFGLCALAINITLCVVLLPRTGIVGASIASSVSYLFLAVGYVIVTRRSGVVSTRDLVPLPRDARTLWAAVRKLAARHA